MRYKGFSTIFVIFIVLFITGCVYLYASILDGFSGPQLATFEISEKVDTQIPTQTLTPTPFPFQEMTITDLRSRSYQSSINELDLYSENDKFSTYSTSYNSDGYVVNGLLSVPKGVIPDGGWPAVIFVHGYIPPKEYKTEQNYVSYMNALSDELVVFKIDLRGHGDSEGEAYGAYFSEQYVVDTLNARNALSDVEFVNPRKIGLWGHSMGGNVVFRSFVVDPEITKVVIWAGAVYTYEDFSEYGISDSSYQRPPTDSERQQRRVELFDTYGSFNRSSNFWQKVVPTNYLEGVVGSVQIHHARNDNVVSIEYSRNLVEVLRGTTIESNIFEYESGGHNITGNSFNDAMKRSGEFLKNY